MSAFLGPPSFGGQVNMPAVEKCHSLKCYLLPQIFRGQPQQLTEHQWMKYSEFIRKNNELVQSKLSEFLGERVTSFLDVCTFLIEVKTLDHLNSIWEKYCKNAAHVNQSIKQYLEVLQLPKQLEVTNEEFHPIVSVEEKSYKIGFIELQPEESSKPSFPPFGIQGMPPTMNMNLNKTDRIETPMEQDQSGNSKTIIKDVEDKSDVIINEDEYDNLPELTTTTEVPPQSSPPFSETGMLSEKEINDKADIDSNTASYAAALKKSPTMEQQTHQKDATTTGPPKDGGDNIENDTQIGTDHAMNNENIKSKNIPASHPDNNPSSASITNTNTSNVPVQKEYQATTSVKQVDGNDITPAQGKQVNPQLGSSVDPKPENKIRGGPATGTRDKDQKGKGKQNKGAGKGTVETKDQKGKQNKSTGKSTVETKKNEKENENKWGKASASQSSGELKMHTTFNLYIPKKKASKVLVHYKLKNQQDKETTKCELQQGKGNSLWSSKPIEFSTKHFEEYVYFYHIMFKQNVVNRFFIPDEEVFEQYNRVLKLGSDTMDIYMGEDKPYTAYYNLEVRKDYVEGCWAYVKFFANEVSSKGVKDCLVTLKDASIITTLKDNYSYNHRDKLEKEALSLIEKGTEATTQFLLYTLCACMNYNDFKNSKLLFKSQAINHLNAFKRAHAAQFPAGSSDILKQLARDLCASAFDKVNPFTVIIYFYDCLRLEDCKDLISGCSKVLKQDPLDIGKCIEKLLPGIQNQEQKAQKTFLMILEKIDDFEQVLAIAHTIGHTKGIDPSFMGEVKEKSLMIASTKIESSLKNCSASSKDSMEQLNHFVKVITDEDLQARVRNALEERVIKVLRERYSHWDESEIESLISILFSDFLFNGSKFDSILNEMVRSKTVSTRKLFLRILKCCGEVTEPLSNMCIDWVCQAIDSAKQRYSNSRETRIKEYYQYLGEMLEITCVNAKPSLCEKLKCKVMEEVERCDICVLMNADPHIERMGGIGKDVFLVHLEKQLVKQESKFKSGNLNAHLETNLGEESLLTLNEFGHVCLVEKFLNVCKPMFVVKCDMAAKNIDIISDILNNLPFWHKIVNARGFYADRVKRHMATRNTKHIIQELLNQMEHVSFDFTYAKKLCSILEKLDFDKFDRFVKDASIWRGCKLSDLWSGIRKMLDDFQNRTNRITQMFLWIEQYNGVVCLDTARFIINNLSAKQKQFEEFVAHIHKDPMISLKHAVEQSNWEEQWFLKEAIAINKVIKLKSFTNFLMKLIGEDERFVKQLPDDDIVSVKKASTEESSDLNEKGILVEEKLLDMESIELIDRKEEIAIDDDSRDDDIEDTEEHADKSGVLEVMMEIDVFIQQVVHNLMQQFRKLLLDNFISLSSILVKEVKYLFFHCSLEKEFANLEMFLGQHLSEKTKTLITYLQSIEDYDQKASGISRMSSVFRLKSKSDSSLLAHSTNCILTMQSSEEPFSLHKCYDCMTEFEKHTSFISENLWEVIYELAKCQGLVEFLHSVINEDLRNLIDAVEEHSEQFVQESTVSDLIQVKSFLYPLLSLQEDDTLQKLMEDLFKCYKHTEKGMPQMINTCSHNWNSLKALYMNVANRGEVTKEVVAKILKEGKVVLLIDIEGVSSKIVYAKEASKITYSLVDLGDLRSRSLLISNTDSTEETDLNDAKGNLLHFIQICDLVVDINQLLQSLHVLGHFNFQHYTYETSQDNLAGKIEELTTLLNDLEEIQEQWKDSLSRMQQSYYYLNFISSTQLCILNDFFNSGARREDALSIMQYIKPCLKDTIKDFNVKQNLRPKNSTEQQLQILGKTLHDVIGDVDNVYTSYPTDVDLWKQMENADAKVYQGKVYVAHIDANSMESIPVLLSLYANTTKLFPLPSEILFCDEKTTWEEVNLLIDRCIYRPADYTNNLYTLVSVEKLYYDIQFKLVQRLKELNKTSGTASRQDFLLAVLCQSVSHDNFLTSLADHVHKIPALGSHALKVCLQSASSKAYMITSDLPGQGKTEKIFSKSADKTLGVVTVQISGPVTKVKLVTQIKKKKIKKHQTLHLNIGTVDQPYLVDSFIFELLVLKCAKAGIQFAHLETDHIAIEVGNTLNNILRDSLHVSSSFERIHLQLKNFNEYLVSTESESAVQTVCKYLSALDTGSIGKTDIKVTSDTKPLTSQDCHKMLQMQFSEDKDLSYSVIDVFLEVLADQLRKFSASQYFKVACLTAMLGDEKSVNSIRCDMIKALIKVSKEFSCRSISTCKQAQNKALHGLPATIDTETNAMLSRVEGMIQWSDSNHLLVLFQSQDNQTVSSLYRELSAVPVDVKKLLETQSRKKLPDFSKYSQDDLQAMLEKLVCTSRDPDVKSRLGSLFSSYALTTDNILKMILIILRVRTGIPVILMGETGCGKTTLVKYLAITCGINLEVIPFHAGVTENTLKSRVLACNENAEADKCSEFWLFLDEINTCDHLGMLKEIICHKSCEGSQLAPNLVVIGACNPYRLRDKNQVFTAGLEGKTHTDEFSQLVYRVHPLPEAMIDYVWDYGTLHQQDEISYIARMVKGISKDVTVEKAFNRALKFSQTFIRNEERNNSAVSLRDVHRCRTLVLWFEGFLDDKSKFSKGQNSTCSIILKAMYLALSHCYEVRLSSTELRQKYWEGISQQLFGKVQQKKHIMDIVRSEQMDILNRLIVPEGIAKNSALRENVFVLFVCILNRIPVFLVGKPGCSKSLSIQLLKSNLRGADSDDDFFKTLPQLYVVSYQGSESSTSDGIIKVFEKAEKYKKHNKKEGVLPVVLLDEVGLAEISQFNPLKVLHSLLEPSTGEYPEVAVVGISNWALDAAKMNRAIHLSRPDLDIHELQDTGKAIRDGLDTESNVQDKILASLAEAYFKYQEKQKISNLKKNFHGLRDYYSLVKYICTAFPSSLEKLHKDKSNSVMQMGIQRNFSGHQNSTEVFLDTFFQLYEGKSFCAKDDKITTKQLIKDNLTDKNARHLMMITKGDYSLGILANILNELGRGYEIIFGSQFDDDLCEEYSYRVLSKIILCMEQGIVLILKDLEGIYGSLYDMLNQNYTIVGMKRNCRIALGAHSNPMCVVHEAFRCIVMVDTDKVDYSDPPFLNRFEKQILHFEDLLQDREKDLITHLHNWVVKSSKIKNLAFMPEDAFLGYHKETIPSLLLHVKNHHVDLTEEDIVKHCKSLLLKTCPPDAIMRLTISELSDDSAEDIESIQDQYFQSVLYESLVEYVIEEISSMKLEKPDKKVVVLTKSNINVNLEQLVGSVINTQVERLGSFKSEKQMSQHIDVFYQNEAELLVMQCTPSLDANHMLLMKLLLENHKESYKHSEIKKSFKKHMMVVIHLNRQDDLEKYGWQFDYTNDWDIITIDRLEQTDFPIKTALLGESIADLLRADFLCLEAIIKQSLIEAFTCMKYTIGTRTVQSIWGAVEQIKNSSDIIAFLHSQIIKHIDENTDNYSKYHHSNWQVKVASHAEVMFQGFPLVEAWKMHMQEEVKDALVKILWFLENTSSWQSYVDICKNDVPWLKDLWVSIYDKNRADGALNVTVRRVPESIEILQPPLALKFPFSQTLVVEMLKVQELFLFEEDIENVESLDQIDERDRSYLIEKYSSMTEQRYMHHIGEVACDENGFQMLEHDFYDVVSFSPDLNIPEDMRTDICQLYVQQKYTNISEFHQNGKFTVVLLTWALQKQKVRHLLQLASACGEETQEHICATLLDSKQRFSAKSNDENDELLDTESIIVDKLCEELLPMPEKLKEVDDSKIWFLKASQLIAFASKLSHFSPLLHFMRVCVDMYTFLPSPRKEYLGILTSFCSECSENTTKAHVVEEPDDSDTGSEDTCTFYLDSALGMKKFQVDVQNLKLGHNTESLQRMMCLYFARCLDANPDTPRLGDIIDTLSSRGLPDPSLKLVGPVIYRLVQNVDLSDGQYLQYLENVPGHDDEDDIIDSMMSDISPSDSHPLIGLVLDVVEAMLKEHVILEESSLEHFENVSMFLHKADKLGPKYFVSLAYARLYLQWVANFLQENKSILLTEKKTYLQKLDATFGSESVDSHGLGSSLQIYMLKEINRGTLRELKEDVYYLGEAMPSMQSIVWPSTEIIMNVPYNALCGNEYYETAKTQLENKQLKNVVEQLCNSDAILQGVIAAVTEKYFWVIAIRPLTDTEKDVEEDVVTMINRLPKPTQVLLKCSLGIEHFRHKCLHVSSQWNCDDIFQASVLLHMTTINAVQKKCIWKSSLDETKNKEYISAIDTYLYPEKTEKRISMSMCPCGNITTMCGMPVTECPQCGSKHNINFSDKVQLTRYSKNVVTEVFQLCRQGFILSSVALGCLEVKESTNLYTEFRNAWLNLKGIMNLTDELFAAFLHVVLHDTSSCTTIPDCVGCLKDLILNHETRMVEFRQNRAKQMNISQSLSALLYETGEVPCMRENDSTFIHRITKLPTIPNLLSRLRLTVDCSAEYSFLELIINDAIELNLLKYLSPLLKWYMVLHRAIHHKMTRKDAESLNFNDFIHDQSELKDIRYSLFQNFKTSWDELRNSAVIDKYLGGKELPEVFVGSPISLCIIQDKEHPLYLMLETLCKIQNDFLKQSAVIGLSGVSSLSFLCRKSAAVIPYTHLHTSHQDNIINLEWTNDLLYHCQNSPDYGYGHWIQYDFNRIEREMADGLLLNKSYLVLDENFPMTVYQSEMFHWCSHILNDIRADVKQEPLPEVIRQKLKRSTGEQHGQQSLRALLNVLEIVISFMHRTRGNSSEKLGTFIKRWGINDDTIKASSVLYLVQKEICLGYIVDMYELVEEEISYVSIESLSKEYRVPLSDELKGQIDKFVKEYGAVTSFLTAVRRFCVRYLSSESSFVEPHMPISKKICHPTTWPFIETDTGHPNKEKELGEAFPATLLAEHTKELHDYLYNIAKGYEQEQEKKTTRQIQKFKTRPRKKFGKT